MARQNSDDRVQKHAKACYQGSRSSITMAAIRSNMVAGIALTEPLVIAPPLLAERADVAVQFTVASKHDLQSVHFSTTATIIAT